MESFNGKRRLSISLSLFTNIAGSFAAVASSSSSCSSPSKSPRIFNQNTSDVVGLSIVAAMLTTNENVSSRPIPIVSSSSSSAAANKNPRVIIDDEVVDELSESYTCVISHFGNNLVQKRVFFDDVVDVDADADENRVFFACSSPMKVGSEIKRGFWSQDFLSSCFLCSKKLHGLDIFMYRGEKAFCSGECRDKHIRSDDLKENCGSEARKQLDYSVTPCTGTQPIFAGVAVA